MRQTVFSLMIAALLLAITSCTGGGNAVSPVTPEPEMTPGTSSHTGQTQTHFWGLWQVVIDKSTGNVDIVDLRTEEAIINVLSFLEPPALILMSIDWGTLNIDPVNNIINVDVILTHPINDPVFMGFDVRGVCFGPEVTNADGLTILTSPQYFSNEIFGYMDGLLGVPDAIANYEGLAGYKYFCDGLGLNDDLVGFMSDPANLDDRGVFRNSSKNRRHYDLDWGNVTHGFLVFNYAIYANYNWPVGDPPIDLDDFDLTTSNSAEAFCYTITELDNTLCYSTGYGEGAISLQVEVWDWQGDISDVIIESTDLGISPTSYDVFVGQGTTDKSYFYRFTNISCTPNSIADLDILLTVIDSRTFGDAWFMNLLNPSNPMHDEPVFNGFTYTTAAADWCSKNIGLRPGVDAYDLAVDHADGDLLILYEDGQVWKHLEADDYQTGSLFINNANLVNCNRIDISPNSCIIVGGKSGGGSVNYSASYNASGNFISVHSVLNPYGLKDVIGVTSTSSNNWHALITGSPSFVLIYRYSPPNYPLGGSNFTTNGSGAGQLDFDLILGCESSSESNYVYFLEDDPEFRVERWTLNLTYGGLSWGGLKQGGMAGFWNPQDITRDNNNDYYILDKLSNGEPRIKHYEANGSPHGQFGSSTNISGDPLRIEGSDYNGNLFVLHSEGLSIFAEDEIP